MLRCTEPVYNEVAILRRRPMTNRREFLSRFGLAAAATAVLPSWSFAAAADSPVATHTIGVLPPLPYAPDALEPFIDAQTMTLHHDKHHQAYVTNLVKAVGSDPKLSAMSVEELVSNLDTVPADVRTAVRNQGGGHANHSLFWPSLKKNNGAVPKAELASAMDKAFSNYAGFQAQFTKAATGVFGSGWAWLVLDPTGSLKVMSLPNQDSPLSQGLKPLFGIDVWEHAYYLKYQNRRPEYIQAFYNVINWDFVTERYLDLRKA